MSKAGAVWAVMVIGMGTSVVRAAEALPTGASLAWTSTDPVVVKARGLVEAGSFSQAEGLLAGADKAVSPQARQARDEMVETIRRIRVEFSLAPDKLLASLQKSIPDATMADIDRWRADGDVRFREIDGKVCYFRREPSSLLRFSKEAKKRRDEHAAKAGKTDSNEAIADQKLVEHIRRVIAAAKQAGKAEVVPVRHRVNYTLTVRPDRPGAKAGSIVRCWLPFPQEYRQQKDVTLIRTSHPQRVVADNAMKGDMLSGPRQRTVYMEQKIEEPAKPVTFEEEFEYLSYAYCPDLKDEDAKPLVAGAISDEYLAERPPHIVFTPEVRAIIERVVGDEKNPLVKARRIFRYVCENMKWCPEVEYAIIPNLSDKGIKAKRGDCGVHAMMFITLCRAAGIPARWQTGWESKPGDSNMHDWAEFYVEPWGWLPCDTSYGFQKSDDPQIREFYFGHQDSYRMIVNLDYGWPLVPPKPSLRSEPADFQRGEVEIDGRNLYFEEWSYEMNFSLKDEAAGQ